ncbi:MAG TPA: alpha/beta hydrolase domain-containing protein [Vicinamibacteria bacterium]|nr:alpha/beta hydrolase domain-containing protein [Vicinamibacteria bacterium]
MRLTALAIVLLLGTDAGAEVARFDVQERRDVLAGKSFGLAGDYEILAGRIYFAFDRRLEPNRIATDIDKAPGDDRGRVSHSADFYLVKPKNLEKGNGTLLLEVGNRGGKGLLSFFNVAAGSLAPSTAAEFGDGFLLERGFSLLWVGWQWDTPKRPGIMRMYPPVATDGGKPIRGLVRSDFVPIQRETDHSLADRDHLPYPVADEAAAENVLTVRDSVEGERRVVPRSKWKFARVENGNVIADSGRVYLEGGFEPRKIYEVVYVSSNPPLVGLGPAGIRDAVSRLKYEGAPELDIARGAFERAIAFGISQSGRFLRTFLYYGFNEDESRRRVFDGVIAHVAGGGRGSFNHRFAQASRDGHPYINFFYPTDIFPFTDLEQVDAETGARDGIFARQKPEHQPKVFYTNSSYEYWGRAASLIHTSLDGLEDAKIPENVRVYHFAGSQHGRARFPAERTLGQQRSNPMDFRWSMRALLVSMDSWIREEASPPESRYARVEKKTLVRPEELGFPSLPGVGTSSRVHKAYRADYGDRFRSEGIVTQEPPVIDGSYPLLVPAVNEDGNEIAGIRLPELAVPLATYTGWNLFNSESGPENVLSSMQGSYIPFARDESERRSAGDPRPSIPERYSSRERYLGLVAGAALRLIEERYLLAEDLPRILESAGQHWDYRVGEN